MTRKTAKDFHPEALKLFDQYVHGQLSRRGFLRRAAQFAAAGVTAEGLLLALSPSFVEAQQVPSHDPRIKARYVECPSPQGYGTLRGYLAQPAKAKGKLPTVLVAHENRGLDPHIEDIARRLALDNFIAFAPDALFPLGGYPGDEDKARELFAKLDQAKQCAALHARGLHLGGVQYGDQRRRRRRASNRAGARGYRLAGLRRGGCDQQ
jgi:carboxymethylenebutenolidase